jgi:site-specific DNA-methyltransferase (adenine-specific)
MSISLIHGDCLEELDKLKGQGVDFDDIIFVSDPPFNVNYHYNNYKDKKDEGEYYEWLANIFGNNAKVIIHYPESLYRFAYSVGEFPEKVVSWVYNANTPKQHRDIAFFNVMPDFTKSGQPYKNPTDKRVKKLIEQGRRARLYDWWEIQQVKNVSKEKTSHVCQMPELVMERIIEILPENKIIVDPFMGSGTTGVACKKLGRDFIGIELDREYYEIAVQRISDTKL